jgi:hypothetical protein
MQTRREFIKYLSGLATTLLVACSPKSRTQVPRKKTKNPKAVVFRAVNGSPPENMEKIISMMGGVETLFGSDDIIIIKPNLQWHNQGAPNISALNRLIVLIMEMKNGFRGQVVLAENIHRGPKPWENAGWAVPFERNSDIPNILNYNSLAEHLKKTYGRRFSVCHLLDIESGSKRVHSPREGEGYVLCDGSGDVPLLSVDNGLAGGRRREVIMSYPIMKTDQNTLIDYRWGVWENGAYTQQPVKLINCAAINHHSSYCGMTSAVKNYLGLSDLSGGSDPTHSGRIVDGYYNFHSFAFNGNKKGPVPGILGAEIGYFLKTIRKPFLNITTAEYCGLIHRTSLPVAKTKVVAASTDPVALDFHMAKYVLYPNSKVPVHHPENPQTPTSQYLNQCARFGDYCFKEEMVGIESFNFSNKTIPNEAEWAVHGERQWGSNAKTLLKYLIYKGL